MCSSHRWLRRLHVGIGQIVDAAAAAAAAAAGDESCPLPACRNGHVVLGSWLVGINTRHHESIRVAAGKVFLGVGFDPIHEQISSAKDIQDLIDGLIDLVMAHTHARREVQDGVAETHTTKAEKNGMVGGESSEARSQEKRKLHVDDMKPYVKLPFWGRDPGVTTSSSGISDMELLRQALELAPTPLPPDREVTLYDAEEEEL
ncbi:hypothetical protein B0T24DRAFT_685632 [Lasiosphaeria ovina]|uniref:Uncharacterized protein n=1 Tax=Lasiosphaeria ovina TaxID=92902 RepID=A0AAE0JS27_9PEZI|nr:hypothetical protein B0T24DRAFT_685632 [Lasiosphaeria ovina]